MPAPFAPLEQPRDTTAARASLAAVAKLMDPDRAKAEAYKSVARSKAPRALLTIRGDASVAISPDGKPVIEEVIRTREQIERGAFMAERGRLLREQRRLEDRFLRDPGKVVALKLAAIREQLTDLELAVAGVDLDAAA